MIKFICDMCQIEYKAWVMHGILKYWINEKKNHLETLSNNSPDEDVFCHFCQMRIWDAERKARQLTISSAKEKAKNNFK